MISIENKQFLTRVDLINNLRKSDKLNKLPEIDKTTFDEFPPFIQGNGEYINFEPAKPKSIIVGI